MFALAMVLEIDYNGSDDAPVELTFHTTIEDARNAVIKGILAYSAEHVKTLEDFVAELRAGGDLEAGRDFDSMTPDEVIQWVLQEAVGVDETLFSYSIKEVPSAA